jgi:hypothetical protein
MKINIKKLIEERNLDRASLAVALFPTAKHPAIALTRLVANRSRLNDEQIYRLSIFCDLSIEQMYEQSLYWKQHSNGGLVRFTMDNWSAILNPATGITKVYMLESLVTTHVLSAMNQPLSTYLSELNQIVINKQVKS